MTFWKDQFQWGQPLTYSNVGSDTLAEWQDLPGNRERIENLKWARDHCDGLMSVVVIVAKDIASRPREIGDSYPRKNLRMKLTFLNEETGEFTAVTER